MVLQQVPRPLSLPRLTPPEQGGAAEQPYSGCCGTWAAGRCVHILLPHPGDIWAPDCLWGQRTVCAEAESTLAKAELGTCRCSCHAVDQHWRQRALGEAPQKGHSPGEPSDDKAGRPGTRSWSKCSRHQLTLTCRRPPVLRAYGDSASPGSQRMSGGQVGKGSGQWQEPAGPGTSPELGHPDPEVPVVFQSLRPPHPLPVPGAALFPACRARPAGAS